MKILLFFFSTCFWGRQFIFEVVCGGGVSVESSPLLQNSVPGCSQSEATDTQISKKQKNVTISSKKIAFFLFAQRFIWFVQQQWTKHMEIASLLTSNGSYIYSFIRSGYTKNSLKELKYTIMFCYISVYIYFIMAYIYHSYLINHGRKNALMNGRRLSRLVGATIPFR